MSNLLVKMSKSVAKSVIPYGVRHAIRKKFPAMSATHLSPATLGSRPAAEPPQLGSLWLDRLQRDKLNLIDVAVRRFRPQSFADLGGVWGVDAGYSFYTLEHHGIARGTLVDYQITEAVRDRQRFHPGFRLLTGPFGSPEMARHVGPVDMVMMFYVLVHQADPNWDEVLQMYATQTSHFLIVNPQYDLPTTLRLIDCEPADYFRHVRLTRADSPYREAFADLDQIDPAVNKPYRTSPTLWQWGITDGDLIATVRSLGFKLEYYQTGLVWPMPHVQSNAFLFRKTRNS